ncbi:MAG: hypothetical protein K5987_02555, partial [Lachnospiraceae bacterium]|nr:hypothetical protein [Lachnospiraceae bacterium]
MKKRRSKLGKRILALMFSAVMMMSSLGEYMPGARAYAAGDEGWSVTNNGESSGTAEYNGMGFVYHSLSTEILSASSGGKECVYSRKSNGVADKNNIVTTTGEVSYADYTAPADGTLTVYVGNAATKTGYVSTADKAIGQYVPGGTGDYDAEGFKVVQGKTWATLYIEVEKAETYYINVSGSKMRCYGAEFVPYTVLKGSVTLNDASMNQACTLKFTGQEEDISCQVEVDKGTYECSLKPGDYAVSLTGEAAQSYAVKADTKRVSVTASETATPAEQSFDIELSEAVFYTVSGALTGFDEVPENLVLNFVPDDRDSYDTLAATINGTSYSVSLPDGETFSVAFEGAFDHELSEAVRVKCDGADVSQDIAFRLRDVYEVTGSFIGLTEERGIYENLKVTPTAISFKNVDDGMVYQGTAAAGSYSVRLRSGSYQALVTAEGYSTTTHVVVSDGAVTRDLLLKDETKKAVDYKDTVYVGKDKEYKTVQAAVDAVSAMGSRDESKRVTIKIEPGVYREQVVVDTPYVTFESDGGNRDNTKISWYYGIGYKYYSCVDSLYDPYADYDKFEKGNVVKYWGSAVITTASATAFRAEGICFENSFNKYMTEEEIADGAEVNGIEKITVARRVNTVADSRAATERAAALVNYADKTEFKKCSFIGSQDTLYTCNSNYDAYYKNCYIEGQTDFIYGNGDVIFDGCEINFCGYSETASAGYITAQSSATGTDTLAEDGYIFRNCYVSYNKDRKVTAGYLGRMWGANCTVTFINTQLQESDMIVKEGWADMKAKVTSDSVKLLEYNTTCAGIPVTTSNRTKGVVTSIDDEKYSVKGVFIDKGWTPSYYTVEPDETPAFTKKPTFSSNGDLNIPNPGETVTVSYSLGDEMEGSDASRIEWYAVSAGYDESSLENILKSATLLKATTAVSSKSFRIPMDCAGKYLMVVVTPMALSGRTGDAEFLLNKGDQPVSNNWSDPDNKESIAPGSGINIYLAGDSTVKDYSALGMYNSGKILSAGS